MRQKRVVELPIWPSSLLTLFPQVTTQFSEDIEAWIELGGILQSSDVNEALKAYTTAADIILRENVNEDVPPEILNNIASCNFQLGKYEVISSLFLNIASLKQH